MVFVLLAWSDIAVRATGFWKLSLDVAETRLAAAELSQARWSAWARDMSWILGTFLGLSPTLKKEISPITTDTLSVAATAAAAAKPLQSCLTLCDPIDGSPPGESLGFSRQEHWSGSPFPSQMHESEKGKRSRSVMSDFLRPHGLQPTRLLCP